MVVYGKPQGKARPRAAMRNGRTVVYTPKETKQYERQIALAYLASGKAMYKRGSHVVIEITAYMPIPASASKIKRQKMLKNEIAPAAKPDLDNIAKIVLDGLNGVAYEDDAQIAELSAVKKYGEIPRVEFDVYEVTAGEN